MSFKGFVDTDVNELRKNLKKRSQLAAEFKEQLDNQQGITNYQKEVAIKQSKPIIEALEKQRDSQTKSTNGVFSEAEEKRILNSNPIAIMEYFRTMRTDLIKNNKETEISLLTVPMKLMKSDIEIKTNGKETILIIVGKGVLPNKEILLDIQQTWLLIFNMDTLKKYDLLTKITQSDINEYENTLIEANDGVPQIIDKIEELNGRKQKPQKIQKQKYGIWENPEIEDMTFMDFVEYLQDMNRNPLYKKDPALMAIMKYNGADGDIRFRFEKGNANSLKIGINAKNKSTRAGTLFLGDPDNKGNEIKIIFKGKKQGLAAPTLRYDLKSNKTKFTLFMNDDIIRLIGQQLSAVQKDDVFNKIYNPGNWTSVDKLEVVNTKNEILEHVQKQNVGNGLSYSMPKSKNQKQPDLSGYGVLRDPFKDARTTKPKGNVVHKSYNIVNGKFGPDIEIDVPKLYTQLHLTAKKGGAIIYDKPVDKDTLDLLTTRPRRQKAYSQTAVKALAKLIKLSDQPINPNSRKLQMIQKYHNKKRESIPVNADDATLDRLTTLILEHNSGNYPNKNLSNEIAQISDSLFKEGMITKKMHKDIYSRYVMD